MITSSTIFVNNSLLTDIVWESVKIDNDDAVPSVLVSEIEPSINLHYVEGILSLQEVKTLLSLCYDRNGWTKSPQRVRSDVNIKGETVTQDLSGLTQDHSGRTSSSCPLIWPKLYKSILQDEVKKMSLSPTIINEIVFTSAISDRVSKFLEVDAAQVNSEVNVRLTQISVDCLVWY